MSERDEMAEAFERSRHYFCGESPGDRAVNWLIWKDAWAAARATPPQAVPALTDAMVNKVLRNYVDVDRASSDNIAHDLRLEMAAAPQPSPEPKEPEHAHDWRFSLQDHVYKCDCGGAQS